MDIINRHTIISVIIPVYNKERTLPRCLDSINNQTFRNFEVIIVDDGSTDYSLQLCLDYSKQRHFFKVYHQNNGGVSCARQLGLDMASGRYVIHVDPDDWVDSTMLSEMYNATDNESMDVVISDFMMEKEHSSQYVSQTIKNLDSLNILQLFADGNLHGSCCNKLVRRSLFSNHNIRFKNDVTRWEDLEIMMRIYMLPNVKTTYLEKAFYHYTFYLSQQSLSKNFSLQSIESQISVITSLEKEAEVKKIPVDFSEMKIGTKMLAFESNKYTILQLASLYPEIDEKLIQSKSIAVKLLICMLRFKIRLPFYIWKIGSIIKHL